MKKIFFASIMVLIFGISFGQQTDTLRSKSGAIVLPVKGDLSFSIDAVPLLNILNPKGISPGYYFPEYAPTIYLKYMVSDKRALMFSPIIKFVREYQDPEEYGENIESEFGFRFGYERRHGNYRLQIPYGLECGFSYINNSSHVQSSPNNFTENGINLFTSLFVGTEYFFLPKMSIGGRFSYACNFSKLNHSDGGASLPTELAKISFNYDNLDGALFLSFYF